MGDKSSIEWTDATWNPVTGCTKISPGCKRCYAKRLFPRVYGKSGRRFEDVAVHHDRLDQPLRWKRARRIFVNSMSDLFHEDVPDEFIDQVFAVIALAAQHRFQILTKRAERMREWVTRTVHVAQAAWPLANVWLGVSVEDQKNADQRIPLLLATPAAVRFLSCEPLLGSIDLRLMARAYGFPRHITSEGHAIGMPQGIHWVIAGGESGPGARPMHPDWARSLRDQCVAAGVSFFFKQWGHHQPIFAGADESVTVQDNQGSPTPGSHPEPHYIPLARGDLIGWRPVGKTEAGRVLDGRIWDEFPRDRSEIYQPPRT